MNYKIIMEGIVGSQAYGLATPNSDIDRLVEVCKAPRDSSCIDCGFEPYAELRTRRSQLGSLNETIQNYFDFHSNNK